MQIPLKAPGDAFSIAMIDESALSEVAALAQRIWPAAYKNILTPEQIDNMLTRIYSLDNLRKEMADGHHFWMAYRGKTPAGFASGYREVDVLWLKKLYVDQKLKGQGIGRKLLYTMLAALQPVSEIKLLVNRNNTPAQRFYEHLGFAKAGEQPVKMGDFAFVDFILAKRIGEEGY